MKPKFFKTVTELEKEIDAYNKITSKKVVSKKDLPQHIVFKKTLDDLQLLPSSDKNSKTKKKFQDHTNYKKLVNDLNYPNGIDTSPIDTWYNNPYYGRKDYNNNFIYHNYWMFQNISSTPNTEICVFDFVADAFEEMKILFNKKKKNNNSNYLQELTARRGNSSTISAEIKYQNYINKKFTEFLNLNNKELKLSSKIKNFNDFKQIFTNFLKKNEGKLTFQGFFNNLNVDIYDSYLAFDIFNDNGNPSDTTKIDFLNDSNYNVYERTAEQSGFIVDQNKPWRLIADLNSKPIVLAMKRRLKVAEELLGFKQIILKMVAQAKEIVSSGSERAFYDMPTGILKGELLPIAKFQLGYELSVEEIKSFLRFVDYFREEIPQIKEFLQKFKDISLTYLEKTPSSDPTEVQYGKGIRTLYTGDEISKDLFDLSTSILNIILILKEKETTINFIFESLEAQITTLQTINKPINDLVVKDVYDAIYTQISDYAFFTYLPRKLEEFYYSFISQQERRFYFRPRNELEKKINLIGKFNFGNYESYVTFSKTSGGETKAVYHNRETNLSGLKLTTDLINDFYELDFIIDYVENRLFERNKTITKDIKNEIIASSKSLYDKSIEQFKKGNEYKLYRNLAISVIEAYINNLTTDSKKLKENKKVPFYAQQLLYRLPVYEPRIMTERLCLTLPERATILVEQEACGKFDGFGDLLKEKPKKPTPKVSISGGIEYGGTPSGGIDVQTGGLDEWENPDPNGTDDSGLEWIDIIDPSVDYADMSALIEIGYNLEELGFEGEDLIPFENASELETEPIDIDALMVDEDEEQKSTELPTAVVGPLPENYV